MRKVNYIIWEFKWTRSFKGQLVIYLEKKGYKSKNKSTTSGFNQSFFRLLVLQFLFTFEAIATCNRIRTNRMFCASQLVEWDNARFNYTCWCKLNSPRHEAFEDRDNAMLLVTPLPPLLRCTLWLPCYLLQALSSLYKWQQWPTCEMLPP